VGEIVAALLLLLIGFVARGYFGAYVSEKGRNLATKEDVAAITTEIERVRAEIHGQQELHTAHLREQQNHLLAFHDVAIEVVHERYAVNFGDLPMDEGRALFEFQSAFRANIVALLRSYQRLVLFLPSDSDLLTYAQRIVNAAVKSQGAFDSTFGKVKVAMVKEQQCYAAGDKDAYRDAVKKADDANRSYHSVMRTHIETFQRALEGYIEALNRFLSTHARTTSRTWTPPASPQVK
jgi:hypothetical protein